MEGIEHVQGLVHRCVVGADWRSGDGQRQRARPGEGTQSTQSRRQHSASRTGALSLGTDALSPGAGALSPGTGRDETFSGSCSKIGTGSRDQCESVITAFHTILRTNRELTASKRAFTTSNRSTSKSTCAADSGSRSTEDSDEFIAESQRYCTLGPQRKSRTGVWTAACTKQRQGCSRQTAATGGTESFRAQAHIWQTHVAQFKRDLVAADDPQV